MGGRAPANMCLSTPPTLCPPILNQLRRLCSMLTNMSLKYLTLEVPRKSLKDVMRWYEEVFGMTVMREAAGAVSLGFEKQDKSAWVTFLATEVEADERGRETSELVYWKIGVALADVNAARNKLVERGVAVTEAQQFRQGIVIINR